MVDGDLKPWIELVQQSPVGGRRAAKEEERWIEEVLHTVAFAQELGMDDISDCGIWYQASSAQPVQ